MKFCIDGTFIDAENAVLPITNWGTLYGDGVFTTMRSYDGVIFQKDAHIDRLLNWIEKLHLPITTSKSQLSHWLEQFLEVNNLKNARLRMVANRGTSDAGFSPQDCTKGKLFITGEVFEGLPEENYRKGVAVAIVPLEVAIQRNVFPTYKLCNYASNIQAKYYAQQHDAFEGLLCNEKGEICEGSISNIFLVKQATLLTPSYGIFPGITRSLVLQLAEQLNIPVKQTMLTASDLYHADEFFLTNSGIELLPVTRIDGKRKSVGRLTTLLHTTYRQLLPSKAL